MWPYLRIKQGPLQKQGGRLMARVCSLYFARKALGGRMAPGLSWTGMWPPMTSIVGMHIRNGSVQLPPIIILATPQPTLEVAFKAV